MQALDGHLALGDNTLNRYLLQALARIGTGDAIRILVSRMRDGGATADLVRHLLSSMGGKVADTLAATYDDESPELQAQIIQILGHYAVPAAMRVLLRAILGSDDALSNEACGFLLERVQEVSESDRKKYRERVYNEIKNSKDLTPLGLSNGLKVMAAINVTQSRATLLKFTQPEHPLLVRQAALLALEAAKLTAAQSDVLLGYLSESDITHVVKPCLVALKNHSDWSRSGIHKLRGLLASRREEMKLFALRSLQEVQSEEVAKIYMNHLHSPKADLRAVAISALGKNAKGLNVLMKSLQNERNPEKARTLIVPLLEHGDRVKPAQVKAMTEKCGKLLAEGNELGEIHLEFLLVVRPQLTTDGLVDKATRLRRARKLAEALRILMHVAKADILDLEGRYQLALARLIKDNDEGHSGVISHTGDATMGFIAGLVRDGFPVFERLKKESMLQPEDLLRVGRHFNASIGPEQRFGTEMLLHVAKKHAKAKAGEEARMMIRSEGLV